MTTSPDGLRSLRALGHPLRLRILSLLTGTAMSAAEAARELGESQANVSYHLRRLHGAGLVRVAEEVSIRGGRAKRYRHGPESGERLEAGRADHLVLAAVLGEELRRRTELRKPRVRGSTTDAEVWVSPQAWQTALRLARQLGEVLHEEAKPPRTPGTVRASATISLFQMHPRQ
ncbi:metalloregulator ArsR/SmtB family transcription factor [Amycolatopsis ultiminotia]|uniref:ArsR/SmtB family transcription factor n=1 Tax=Amycolatopsis ultiminotia TaxID=543629 RepID=UPI0031E6D32D